MFFKDRPFTKWNSGQIRCPVLVIRGQHDKVTREDHVREVLESLENAPVRKLRRIHINLCTDYKRDIKRTAHGVEYSRPKDTCKLLLDFMDELDVSHTANRE
jgi:pimeloyl-ACP methyl ester carboxylesterase